MSKTFFDTFWCFFSVAPFRWPLLRSADFLKLFNQPPPDIPAKSRDIPPKSLFSLGFEGHIELLGPPLHVEDPLRTGRYPEPKVWVCAPSSYLSCCRIRFLLNSNIFQGNGHGNVLTLIRAEIFPKNGPGSSGPSYSWKRKWQLSDKQIKQNQYMFLFEMVTVTFRQINQTDMFSGNSNLLWQQWQMLHGTYHGTRHDHWTHSLRAYVQVVPPLDQQIFASPRGKDKQHKLNLLSPQVSLFYPKCSPPYPCASQTPFSTNSPYSLFSFV